LVTAKLDLLPRRFFATQQSLVEVYVGDWARLGKCVWHSLMLLVTGYATGAVLGVVTGLGASGPSLYGAVAGDRMAGHSRILVFQDPSLFPWCTVRQNVALGLEIRGLLQAQSARIDDALRQVGLDGFDNAYPHQLSGGRHSVRRWHGLL
jgi:ABC-type taurine transport system ATPase subunit